jgi:pimeloyl-ACP methyl ester carboxylesterase
MSITETGTTRRSSRPDPSDGEEGMRRKGSILVWLWSDWWIGSLAAVVVATGFGLMSAWLTPRGPITTGEALVSMTEALLVGMAAGVMTGSRWSMLLAPVVFGLAFEIARLDVVGPTVDAIQPFSFYGMVAFALGRVVHGILVLAPMVLGASYGMWLARRLGNETATTPGLFGWTLMGLATLALLAVAFSIAPPASTAPIIAADGEAVAELTTVVIGGHEQALMIRGRSVDNPVLLYLTGGPGGTDIGALRQDVGLEQDFVVVNWEQRGAGKSYAALDPTETFTVDQLVADTIEVTNYLRDRFDEDRIFLVGQSWGSTLGVLAAQQHPELYHAFVGVGQMVSQRATDRIFWEDTLAWAEDTGNNGLAETLRRNGPPPYDDIILYEPVVAYEHNWNPYPGLDLDNEMPNILFVPEYTWMDRINAFKGFLDTNATLYPQLQGIDFRADVLQLDVPYYMVLGEHEARGRAVLANQWFETLEAPSKERVVFEGSGHRAHFDRPGEFAQLMRDVLADTSTETSTG